MRANTINMGIKMKRITTRKVTVKVAMKAGTRTGRGRILVNIVRPVYTKTKILKPRAKIVLLGAIILLPAPTIGHSTILWRTVNIVLRESTRTGRGRILVNIVRPVYTKTKILKPRAKIVLLGAIILLPAPTIGYSTILWRTVNIVLRESTNQILGRVIAIPAIT